jgi:hypothetical protein
MRRLSIFVLVGLLAGCASAGTPDPSEASEPVSSQRGESHLITSADLVAGGPRTLLNAVRDLRPRWLQVPGGAFATVSVFVGDSRAGDAAVLATIETSAVREVRFFETTAAQQRFARASGPVIQVFLK